MRGVLPLLAVALVAGCSSGGQPSAESSVGGLPPHATSGPTADSAFLSVVRDDFPSSISDALLIRLAHDMCEDFDRGVEWVTEVATLTKQGGVPARAAGSFIAAAVATYCPDNVSVLPGG